MKKLLGLFVPCNHDYENGMCEQFEVTGESFSFHFNLHNGFKFAQRLNLHLSALSNGTVRSEFFNSGYASSVDSMTS